MKRCPKCDTVKELSEFNPHKTTKSGYSYLCRSCKENKKRDSVQAHAYYLKTKNEKEAKRLQRVAPITEAKRLIRLEKREEYLKIRDLTKHERIADQKLKAKLRYIKNRDHKIKMAKEYKQKNKVVVKQKLNAYERRKRKEDPIFNLICSLRSRTYVAFKRKNWRKDSRNVELLGVTLETAKAYIERQFKKGMSWNNRSEWHIDHIIPLAFAKTPE